MNGSIPSEIDENFSRRITALRFILAVLVVFIHSDGTEVNFANGTIFAQVPLYVKIVQNFFTEILGNSVVPLFFLISSYLFFAKQKSFSTQVKSKFRTIVLPYIFWTFFTILIFFVAQTFSFSKNYFVQKENIIRNFQILDFFKAFIGRKIPPHEEFPPLVYQFWYLRNLILFMAISPLIRLAVSRFPSAYFCTVISLTVLRAFGVIKDPFWIFPAFFFFSLGIYAVKYISKILNFLDSINWKEFLFGFAVFSTARFFISHQEFKESGLLNFIGIIFTIAFFIKFAGIILKSEKLYSVLKRLSAYSFWIYAAHAPFVVVALKKIFVKIIPMRGALVLLQFFATAGFTIAFLLAAGFALKKLMPKIFAFVCGGR